MQKNSQVQLFVTNSIEQLIEKADGFLKAGRIPPKYFPTIDVHKALQRTKEFPWKTDEQIRGITNAGFGFVISNPSVEDYRNLEPWQRYWEEGIALGRKVIVLGGGNAFKEVGLLNQYAASQKIIAQPNIVVTDLNDPKEKIARADWKNLSRIDTRVLDLANFNDIYETIKQFQPDIVTLISILSVFPPDTQERILQVIYQSLPPGGNVLYGTALPATPVNFYGYPVLIKAERVVKSAQDFLAAMLMTPEEQERFPNLYEPQELRWSEKGKIDYFNNAAFNLEWSLWLTNQIDRLKRVGFEPQIASLKGVKGKFGTNRPEALPPYLTIYVSKPENINIQLTRLLKKTTVIDKVSSVRLVPFDGSESEKYEEWFDRSKHAEEMKYQHKNTPYTTNPRNKVGIPEFIDFMARSPHNVMYKIVHPEYGFVGHVSLNGINYKDMSCWLGYHIGSKEMWGKGIGKNAVKEILAYLKKTGFKTVYSWSDSSNMASIKILNHFFEETGTDRSGIIHYKKVL